MKPDTYRYNCCQKSIEYTEIELFYFGYNTPLTGNFINFERKHCTFVWNDKLDKIKRNSLVQIYKNDGLKIIDCKNFMTTLKSSWVRSLTFSQFNRTELFETH